MKLRLKLSQTLKYLNCCLPAGMLLLLGSGCDVRREAIGVDNEVIVIVSHDTRPVIKPILAQLLADTLYTPQPQPYYRIRYAGVDEYERYRTHGNVFLVALEGDPGDPGSNLVQQLLPEEQYRTSRAGGNAIFLSADQYARHQVFVIMNARDGNHLAAELARNQAWLLEKLDREFENRQAKYLFHKARQKTLEKHLLDTYGWGMLVPWGYVVVRDEPERNFFWMGRDLPYRWLAVHWQPGTGIQDDSSAVRNLRAFFNDLYTNIRLNPYQLQVREVDFKHWTAYRISGIWEAREEAQGGPFIHYLFYDGITDRTYQIDMLVHYPGEDKVILMRQLDMIAHSFFVPE